MENSNEKRDNILNNIYKDKPTERINEIKIPIMNLNKENENKNEIDNDNSQSDQKKRRQGLWFENIIQKEKQENKVETLQYNLNEDKIEEVKENNCSKLINKIKDFEISKTGCIIMLIIVLLSLFYYDFKILFFPKSLKIVYRIFYGILIIYSYIDFIIRNIIMKNVINTFYFWIDCISSIIMIFEYDSISYPLLRKILFPNNKTKYMSYYEQSIIENVLDVFQVIKLIRVVKFYKLFIDLIKENEKRKNIMKILDKINEKRIKLNKKSSKHIKQSISSAVKENNNNTTSVPLNHTPVQNLMEGLSKSPNIKRLNPKSSIFLTINSSFENKKWEEDMIKYLEEHMYKRNKISEKVTEGISRLMIVIVLLVFIVSIFTDEDNYNSSFFSYKIICKYLNRVSNKYMNYNSSALNKYIEKYFFSNILNQYPVIQIEFFNQIIYQNKSMDLDLKNYMKRDICYIFDKKHPSVVIIISRRNISKMISVIYLCRLFYIVTAISLLCYLINSNIYYLIFRPLENIGKVIDIISKDPVGSESITKLKKSIQNSKNQKKEDKGTVGYEIKIIQSAIIRISTLMAIGFGEAGGEILKRNISSSEGLNPMLSGKKINAIFGFCFIHNFSEINEAFQEKTMIFVNQISDIVHSCVDKFKGITNKNLGDCYLLAWKFKEKNKQNNNNNNNNNNKEENNNELHELQNSIHQESNISINENEILADCALLSFLNIIKKINKCQNILAYRKDIDLIKKFGPRYTVQMGFGLHTGWGIEGAIGSYYKIDCSYLSPNVNIAARLETATNIYGVDILFSGEFYDLLSDFMKRKCRKIDIVTLKGSEKPICLYTVDVNKNIYPGKIVSKKDRMTLRERRSYYDLKKKKLWNKYKNMESFNSESSIGELYLKQSKGLRQLLKKNKSDMFYQYFEDGFGDYINGDWKDAALNLEKARYLDKSDGPTRTILDYIKKLNLTPPNNWDGYRVLTSKT